MSNIKVYVDASHDSCLQITGWGVLAICGSESIMRCGSEKKIKTSLDAEMVAAYCGVIAATREWTASKITIISDCEDIIRHLKKVPYHNRKNRDFRDRIVADIEAIAKEQKIKMFYQFTKGHQAGIEHAGVVSNKCVDSLARAARFEALIKRCKA